MTDYDFINPDLPEENSDEEHNPDELLSQEPMGAPKGVTDDLREKGSGDEDNTEDHGEDNRGFLGRAYNSMKNAMGY